MPIHSNHVDTDSKGKLISKNLYQNVDPNSQKANATSWIDASKEVEIDSQKVQAAFETDPEVDNHHKVYQIEVSNEGTRNILKDHPVASEPTSGTEVDENDVKGGT